MSNRSWTWWCKMKLWISSWLRRVGILRANLLVERRSSFPNQPLSDPTRLILVEDRGLRKWACFGCPGGCGEEINLSLNPDRRPRWSILTDFWLRPTISPSVHQRNACGCHFWVKRGRIEWCKGGRPAATSASPVAGHPTSAAPPSICKNSGA